jgi:hypothetical protein
MCEKNIFTPRAVIVVTFDKIVSIFESDEFGKWFLIIEISCTQLKRYQSAL